MIRLRATQLALPMILCVIAPWNLCAQGRGGRGGIPQVPQTAKQAAPIDITGYWVAQITEDWRFRMLTPPKGDFAGVPLNPEGRKVAAAWDPAKDEAAGEQCKGYGAPSLMRLPVHLHITWQDDQVLKLEADSGTQTRLFYFGAPQGEGGDWQGASKATWEYLTGRPDRNGGTLKVVTTKLRPGYLRKNGVPYSANAVLTEYFDRVNEPNGDSFLVMTSTLEDPAYLAQPFLTSAKFRKQADATDWHPTPCMAR